MNGGLSPRIRPRALLVAVALPSALGLAAIVFSLTSPEGSSGQDVANAATASQSLAQISGEVRTVPEDTTQNSANSASALPLCGAGQLPHLDIANFPTSDRGGAPTPEAALRALHPDIGAIVLTPMGTRPQAPVWIETRGGTFIATILRDGTWFVSPAQMTGCR